MCEFVCECGVSCVNKYGGVVCECVGECMSCAEFVCGHVSL